MGKLETHPISQDAVGSTASCHSRKPLMLSQHVGSGISCVGLFATMDERPDSSGMIG